MSDARKLGAAALALLLVGGVSLALFGAVWFRIGFGAAVLLLSAVLIYLAWRSDRKARDERAGLERI